MWAHLCFASVTHVTEELRGGSWRSPSWFGGVALALMAQSTLQSSSPCSGYGRHLTPHQIYIPHRLFKIGELTGCAHQMAAICSHTTTVKYSLKLHPWIKHPHNHLMLTLRGLQVTTCTVHEALNSCHCCPSAVSGEYSFVVSHWFLALLQSCLTWCCKKPGSSEQLRSIF